MTGHQRSGERAEALAWRTGEQDDCDNYVVDICYVNLLYAE